MTLLFVWHTLTLTRRRQDCIHRRSGCLRGGGGDGARTCCATGSCRSGRWTRARRSARAAAAAAPRSPTWCSRTCAPPGSRPHLSHAQESVHGARALPGAASHAEPGGLHERGCAGLQGSTATAARPLPSPLQRLAVQLRQAPRDRPSKSPLRGPMGREGVPGGPAAAHPSA